MKRRVALLLCVALPTGVALVSALRHASADSSSAEAARLVARMRDAPSSMEFSGVVRVAWRDNGQPNDITVDITDDQGSIEVQSSRARVFDRGTRTYFKGELGWSSALVEPNLENIPPPDHRWSLSVRRGPAIVGRPTQLVEATRRNGAAVQRLYLDTDTGLLLRREVLDARGHVQRSLEFLQLTVASGPELQAPTGVSARNAVPLDEVPAGYETTGTPSGYVLVGRSRHPNGVELVYADGLFSVSVLEQRGELDWDALPRGGVATEVDGNRARRYSEPGVDVILWEHDGTVFTAVSDAPADVIDAMIAGFSPDRSAAEKVADFVLGPFGWS
ncbi:MAG: hypothetical protein WD271_11450 [Acidimicrobiia bacterium]